MPQCALANPVIPWFRGCDLGLRVRILRGCGELFINLGLCGSIHTCLAGVQTELQLVLAAHAAVVLFDGVGGCT